MAVTNLLDTNILLYLIGGKISERDIPRGNIAISFVTELEILSYPDITIEDEWKIRELLNEILIVDINEDIKKYTVDMRKGHRLKLPDAIVAGTAIFLKANLITNDREFSKVSEVKSLSITLKGVG